MQFLRAGAFGSAGSVPCSAARRRRVPDGGRPSGGHGDRLAHVRPPSPSVRPFLRGTAALELLLGAAMDHPHRTDAHPHLQSRDPELLRRPSFRGGAAGGMEHRRDRVPVPGGALRDDRLHLVGRRTGWCRSGQRVVHSHPARSGQRRLRLRGPPSGKPTTLGAAYRSPALSPITPSAIAPSRDCPCASRSRALACVR